MGLPEYFRVLRHRWWLVGLAIVVCIAGASIASGLQERVYASSMTLYLATPDGVPDNNLPAGTAQERIATYSTLAESADLIRRAIEATGMMIAHVSVTASNAESPIFMRLDLMADSADGVYALALAYREEFPRYAAEFQGLNTSSNPPVVVLEEPQRPSSPVSPDVRLNLLVGFALGLALGVGGAFLLESIDRSLRTAAETESLTGLSLLASIPMRPRGRGVAGRLGGTDTLEAEAIRKLRTNVRFAGVSQPLRSFVLTSAVSGEGKTTTAVDLAIMCSEAGQQVVLVDADLRNPAVASVLGVDSQVGLTNVLVDDLALGEVLLRVGANHQLAVLPSGPVPANPSELLGSSRMQELVRELTDSYELVIFDSPPVLPVTDALVLAQALDGVIVVTRLGYSRRDRLTRAVGTLKQVDLRLVGLVCIGGPEADGAYAVPLRSSSRKGWRKRRASAAPVVVGPAGSPRHHR